MRRAIVILATSVAFLLSGQAFAVRQPVNVPLEGELLKASTVTSANGTLNASKVLTPVNITVGTKSVPVPVSAFRKIPTSNIATITKNGLKANIPSLLVSGAITTLVAGVGWVMTDGVVSKKIDQTAPVNVYCWKPVDTNLGWPCSDSQTLANNASSFWGGRFGYSYTTTVALDSGKATGSLVSVAGTDIRRIPIYSQNSCPGQVNLYGSCVIGSLTVPLVDSDYDVLDGFIKGKDGVWQRDLATSVCDSLPNPEACYASLPSERILTGPSVVTAPSSSTSSSTSTTNSTGTQVGTETSTKTETPTATITYGDTYIEYSPTTTTTTTTTNNNGTSTSTETSDIPTVPDALSGINDPLGGLPGEISGQASSISPVPYHSWFSMGGSCKEHTFQLPVIGPLTTNYCPIHEQYVRPFLAFMFALWTFHYCFQIWRESVTRVRAD